MSYLELVQTTHPTITFPVLQPSGRQNVRPRPSTKHIENTAALLDAYGIEAKYNLMSHTLELKIPGFVPDPERAENATVSMFKSLVQRNELSSENSMGHLRVLARSYHPVRDWILSKPWDGKNRLSEFMDTIRLVDDDKTHLSQMLVQKWLVGAVRAVMPDVPGERPFTPQGVLTFQGQQGIGKTEWFKSLAPAGCGWICTGRVLDPHNRDSVQQITSFWISELGELDATFKKTEVVAMKAFITQEKDVYRSAFAEREESIPRRTMLGASVNPEQFLADETGNRRWWVVAVKSLDWGHKVDMQQLWAQVAVMVERGASWWLSFDEINTLGDSNKDYEVVDPLVAELWETWRLARVAEAGKWPRVKLADVWDGLPLRTGKPMDVRQSRLLAEALRKMDAQNPGRSSGMPTYRVELINPKSYGYQTAGSFPSAFKPVAYKDD